MNITHLAFLTAALTMSAAEGQQLKTGYSFRVIAQPGTTIGAHIFTRNTTIEAAAINDKGEIAFVAKERDAFAPTAVFTSSRIVAVDGDVIDGKTIQMILPEGFAIDSAGQVAYEAWYADNADIAKSGEPSGLGIFVDRRFILRSELLGGPSPISHFAINDTGQIIVYGGTESLKELQWLNQTNFEKREWFIHLETPSSRLSAPSAITANKTGQIVLPVNFEDGGFLLLIGRPRKPWTGFGGRDEK